MVQSAHQTASRNLGEDIAKAVVRLTRRGRVVKRQHDPGKKLDQDHEKSYAAKDLMPPAGRRNVFSEEVADTGRNTGPLIQPLNEPAEPLPHAASSREQGERWGSVLPADSSDCFRGPSSRRPFLTSET